MHAESWLAMVAAVLFVGMLVFALSKRQRTKDNRWLGLATVMLVLLGLVAYSLAFGSAGVVSSSPAPAPTTAPIPAKVDLKSVSPTVSSPAAPVAEEIEPSVVVEPVNEEYVSHIFVANQLGLRTGAKHSLYLSDRESSPIASTSNDNMYGYFMTSVEKIEDSIASEVVEFKYVDSTGEAHHFQVPSGLVEYAVSNHRIPRMAVHLQASLDQETGVYGVTEYWESSAEHRANTDICVLKRSPSDPNQMFCYWKHYNLVAKTSLDKQKFDRGLDHVLNHGVGLVKVHISEQLYEQIFDVDYVAE